MNGGYAFHNAYKGESQNIDLSYGQLDHNGCILKSELEWKKMNFLLIYQHSETRLDWSS